MLFKSSVSLVILFPSAASVSCCENVIKCGKMSQYVCGAFLFLPVFVCFVLHILRPGHLVYTYFKLFAYIF